MQKIQKIQTYYNRNKQYIKITEEQKYKDTRMQIIQINQEIQQNTKIQRNIYTKIHKV